ncbi:aprataxin and PNK-like factor [Thrips palmi]|uniref:Aprataxin and PNK-like factor n=1 Tax=Thrips palmi TaxID=161013 RepID=A0A6P8XY31_THRPL|nr:aprataxin and PNK-like factor [Thrips palmi]XP_034232001.1 aprataxin and PNK-like factor [Thrips palmi]XP_034232002.1 aprataxin and PNK-like factor [Thrips palmi]XP_034232003.1 aprataxin and PNK-like factor [Thrips palmi]
MSSKKKRSLPSWMKNPGTSTQQNVSASVSTSPTLTSPKVLSTLSHANGEDSDAPEDKDLRNFKDMISDTEDNSSNNFNQDNSPHTSGAIVEDNHDDEGTSSPKRSVTPDTTRTTVADTINDPILVTNGMASPPATRKSCFYGSSCYRKNPQHRRDFAHPGDADFSDAGGSATSSTGGSPANDVRPLCEYGTACYRKNPQHRRDFRHDAPHKRKARPSDLQDIPSDHEGDFNDSFSSEDYKPGQGSESDDSFVTSDSMGSGDSDFDPEDEEENEKKAKKRRKKDDNAKKKRAKKD